MVTLKISLILQDAYLKRVKTRKLLESLILVGAFDIFGKIELRYYIQLIKSLIK